MPTREDFRAGPLRMSPWFASQLTVQERRQVIALIPADHWIVGTARDSRKGRTFIALLAGPQGSAARAESGLPVVACLRALGIEA